MSRVTEKLAATYPRRGETGGVANRFFCSQRLSPKRLPNARLHDMDFRPWLKVARLLQEKNSL